MPKSTSRIKNNEQYTRRCDFRSKMFKMPLPLFKHDWTSAHRVRVVDGTLYDIYVYIYIYLCYVLCTMGSIGLRPRCCHSHIHIHSHSQSAI